MASDGSSGLKATFAVNGERNASRRGDTMSSAARGVLRLPAGELRLRLWGGKPGGRVWGGSTASQCIFKVHTTDLPSSDVGGSSEAGGASSSAAATSGATAGLNILGALVGGSLGVKAAVGFSEKAGEEDDEMGRWLSDRSVHTTFEFAVPYKNPTEACIVDTKGVIGAAGSEHEYFAFSVTAPCQLVYEISLVDGASYPVVGDLHFVAAPGARGFVSVSVERRDAMEANHAALKSATEGRTALEAAVEEATKKLDELTVAKTLSDSSCAELEGEVARLGALNKEQAARIGADLQAKEEALRAQSDMVLKLTTEKLELEAQLRKDAITLQRSRSAEHRLELDAVEAKLAEAQDEMDHARLAVGEQSSEVAALAQRLAAAKTTSVEEQSQLRTELAASRAALEEARRTEAAARDEEATALQTQHAQKLQAKDDEAQRMRQEQEGKLAAALTTAADAAAQAAQNEAAHRDGMRSLQCEMEAALTAAQGEVTAKNAIIAEKDRQIRGAMGEKDRHVAAAQQLTARAGRRVNAVTDLVGALSTLPNHRQRASFEATKATLLDQIAALDGGETSSSSSSSDTSSMLSHVLVALVGAIDRQRANGEEQLANAAVAHGLLQSEMHAMVQHHVQRAEELEHENVRLHQQSMDGERAGARRMNPLLCATFDKAIAESMIRQVIEQERRRAGHVSVSADFHQGTCGYYAEHRLVQTLHLAVFNERISLHSIEAVVNFWCQCADALGPRARDGGDRTLSDVLEQLHDAVEACAVSSGALAGEAFPFADASDEVEAAVQAFLTTVLPSYLNAAMKLVTFATPRAIDSVAKVSIHAYDRDFPISMPHDQRPSTKCAGAFLDSIDGKPLVAIQEADDGFGRVGWLIAKLGGASQAVPLFPLTCSDY